jgi:hypothetical protein
MTPTPFVPGVIMVQCTAAHVAHAPFWQTPLVPHEVPSGSGVPAAHFWPGVLFGPITVAHVSTPLQGFPSSQLFGDVVHENVQPGSQPEPATLFPIPKSHCSGGSTTPSPHEGATHVFFTQNWFVPQLAPSWRGVPGLHAFTIWS